MLLLRQLELNLDEYETYVMCALSNGDPTGHGPFVDSTSLGTVSVNHALAVLEAGLLSRLLSEPADAAARSAMAKLRLALDAYLGPSISTDSGSSFSASRTRPR